MLKKLILCVLAAATTIVSYGQGGLGTIQGKIKDKATGELLPFVNVVLEVDGQQKGGGSSDFDGNFKISSVQPGTYSLRASSIGYRQAQIDGVVINANKITFLDIELESGDVVLDEVVVTSYAVPLIDKDGGASGGTVTRDDIAKMPGRSATSIAMTVGGVYSTEGSSSLSIRGSRSDASYYYIDGIKVRGASGLPKSAIEEVSVITGGLPANYGDATGGVISITTRGPQSKYFGGIDMLTSGFKVGDRKTVGLDKYGYNLIEGSLSGPLIMKKDSTGKKVKPILGFFISGNYINNVDGRPFFTDSYIVKDDVRANLIENPLRPTGTGFGVFYNTDFLRLKDFEKVNFRQNAGSQTATASGKIDVNTGPSINLTFGGSLDWSKYNSFSFDNSLFNSTNNAQVNDLSWRVYGRFTQRFNQTKASSSETTSSLIKNAFYTVMVDYSKYNQLVQDADHQDNLFNYGYVGNFKTYRENSYEFGTFGNTFARIHNGFDDTLVVFTPSEANADLAAITNQYFSLYDDPTGNYENLTQIQAANALRNGDQPANVYGLWNNIGTQYNGYSKIDNTQFRVTASGSADIGNHAVTVGFEYEQRTDRSFSVSPVGLWQIARQYMNFHIRELDLDNPMVSYFGTFAQVDYNRLVGSGQYAFDRNFRDAIGVNVDGNEFIDIDDYDPSLFKLDMFSADELLNNGSNYVTYYGYTYDGQKSKGRPSFDDFFTKKDADGNFTREIPAFEPIYIAGYIMDKFTFDDLIFNVGLRIDRFDANQPVLKDRFLLYQAKTVGEVDAATEFGEDHPTNMGTDYTVYVNDIYDPTAITGYRNGNTWYNASGEEITDPRTIYSAGGVAPYLIDNPDNEISSTAFQDYKPQINVMPRVAFSFPISDEALFFAHYDVLTKRPTSGNRLDILDYYYMRNRNVVVNNPDLKPEKTVDYELGFQQVLTKSSSLKISAFYRELRDQVALVNVTGAYPRTYRSWSNIDFGTIKGLTITYDLRRTGNLWMRASYTLQFAEGTGSDAGSALNLVNSGQPNLRTIYPFSYDQRHGLNMTFDYRYGEGKDYNGPKLFGKDILANTGINVVSIFGSGTPYSAQQVVTPQAYISGATSGSLEGQVNGSRKPGQFRMDAQIDKNIILTFGKKDAESKDKAKTANLNIYLQVNNVLNTQNILGVYGATGTADDDGYLADARYQQAIAQQNSEISFREYYALKVNNPYNFGLPRTIRLGVKLDF